MHIGSVRREHVSREWMGAVTSDSATAPPTGSSVLRRPASRKAPVRSKGQTLIEFAGVALVLALLISGMFDLSLLVNARLSVSSLARELARAASVTAPGSNTTTTLTALADRARILGVTNDSGYFSGWACEKSAGNCSIVFTVQYQFADCPVNPSRCGPQNVVAGEQYMVEVTVEAPGAEVVTPLIRPALGCTNGAAPHCFIQNISAKAAMFYEFQPAP